MQRPPIAGGICVLFCCLCGDLWPVEAAASADGLERTAEVIEAIDSGLAAVWKEYDLQPSKAASDGEWCRRLYLDLLGRIPRLEELQRFVRNRSKDKRQQLTEQLLFDPSYAAEYARHWTDVWAHLLVGRTGGLERNSLTNRDGLEQYLFATFSANKPLDQFAHELIAAEGTNSPGSEKFNGAVNFLTMKLADKATQATARTAQLFLGRQVQCTQCHDHPSNDWKQNQFWELNAFFRQTVPLRRFQPGTRNLRTVELTDQDFGGEGNTPGEAEVYYERRNGLLQAAYPTFLDGQEIHSRSGYLDDVHRRRELATLIRQSPLLAESLVNRLWGHFLGYGFTSPVDDMGPHNPPTHPALLDELAAAFRQENYDLKQLIRWIVLSQPYRLSSRTHRTNQSDDPQLGELPKFSRFYLRQITPEQLYQSLSELAGKSSSLPAAAARTASAGSGTKSLTSAPEADASSAEFADRPMIDPSPLNTAIVSPDKRRWLRQFTRALGNDEAGESSTFNGTIPQTLMMFNGGLVRDASETKGDTTLAGILTSETSFNEQVSQLFLAAVARKPNSKELKLAKQLVLARHQEASHGRGNNGQRGRRPRKPAAGGEQVATAEGLRDLLWALLNSNEFILNH